MKNIIYNLGLDREDKLKELAGVTQQIETLHKEILRLNAKLPIITKQTESLGRAIELLKAGETLK